MSTPGNQLVPALAVVQAMRKALGLLTLVQPGAPWDGQPAFEKVGLFPIEKFEDALIQLIETASSRVCLLVPVAVHHDNTRAGRNLTRLRSLEIVLLVADQVFGDFDAASAFSDTTLSTPGAFGLAEAVDTLLQGAQLAMPHIGLEVGDWEPLAVNDKAGTGRSALAVTVRTSLGHQVVSLGRPLGRALPGTFAQNTP